MGFLSVADVLTSLVTSVVAAVGGLLCSPLYDNIKASLAVLNSAESFAADVGKLSNTMKDIKAMRPSDEIDRWLPKAEKIKEKARQLLSNQDRSSCCINGHGISRCKLQKKVRKLTIQGQNIRTCANLDVEPVEHVCGVPVIEDGSAAERNLNLVLNMLNNDEVWSIGVWGPGGVGKTTLANALINKLEKSSSFTLVRFVELTKDVEEIQVQKAIAEKLQLQVKEGVGTREIANQIYNSLQREKFLFILDNVWNSIDLQRIGIPENQNGSKVMLTTRRKNVCMAMKFKPIEIGYLDDTEAWKLFAEKAGGVVTHPEIQPLAKEVYKECGGLPLALVAVGSAMSGKDNVHQWRSTLNDLRSSNFPDDMEPQVYKPLKLSYDFLANETLKSCFLYCSLYPEGFNIRESELVWCWLAESIFDENLTYESAYSNGLDLIESLKNSCLLLEGDTYMENHVKLHDVVRDVATRIAKSNGTSIVFSGHGISKRPEIVLPQDVENIRCISFVDNDELALPEYKKDFPKVTTFVIRAEGVQVPEAFLKGFQALRVLNVWSPQSFPHSPLHLADLRALLLRQYTGDLEELPCGTKLMVLDLSGCSFYKLPRGIEKLTSLRVLVLSCTENLKTIEVDVILNLSALEVLDMRMSGYEWATVRKSDESKEVVLQDLSRLKRLKEAYLDLADFEATYEGSSWMQRLKRFGFCHNCWLSRVRCEDKVITVDVTGGYKIEGNKIGSFILHAEMVHLCSIEGNVNEIFANFNPNSLSNSKMKVLDIHHCSLSKKLPGPIPNFDTLPNLEDLSFSLNKQFKSFYQIANALGTTFPKLRRLFLEYNKELENVLPLDYPQVLMPELEEIYIYGCPKMTKVFHDGPSKTQAVVPKLESLRLRDLESLQCLCSCGSSEHWQSLEVLRLEKCPNLKKLPPMISIKEIRGEEEWWNNLEWDSPETKSHMNQFFKPQG